jgi:hypothetical protein
MCPKTRLRLAAAFLALVTMACGGLMNRATPGPEDDLEVIFEAYEDHQETKGRPPSSSADLEPLLKDDPVVAASLKAGKYSVFWNADLEDQPVDPSKTVLAYQTQPQDGKRAVVMVNGDTQVLTNEQFNLAPKAVTK